MADKYVDASYRIANNAFMRDKHGNEYSGEQLSLALLLHARGKTKRGSDEEKYVAALLDDPNSIR